MTTPGHGDTSDQGIAGPGGVFLDQYVLLELLSDSRRGAIYKAKHRLMGRTVAIKFLSDQAAASRQFTERFHRATKILALLEHPNLVQAHEAAQQGNTSYLVMEFIDGENLQYLTKAQGPLPIPKAIDYAVQAASGLAYAHDQGVIHRNIKPGKLVVDGQGAIKIVGFGLAHIEKDGALGEGDDAESLTIQGQVLGSYEYMAPEQAADAKKADQRSDIYGLGCTLHALLTGRPPYEGKGPTMQIVAHSTKPVPSLRVARPEVPEALDRVFEKMLAKNPDERFTSMHDVVRELKTCLPTKAAGKAAIVPPPPPVASPDQGSNKLLFGIAGGTLAGLVLISLIAFGLPGGDSATKEKPPAAKPTDAATAPPVTPPAREKPEARPAPNNVATSTLPRLPPEIPSVPPTPPDVPAKEPATPKPTEKPKPAPSLSALLDTLPPDAPTPPPPADPAPSPEPSPKPEPEPAQPESPVSVADALPPVPSENARSRASQLMRDTFEADLAQASTPAEKSELATRLLSVATEIKDDLAGRYVILEEVTGLAMDAGDFAMGLDAIDRMARSFAIEPWSKKYDWLAACADTAKTSGQRRAAATEVFELAKEAYEASQFEHADRLCTLAESEGKKAAPFPLIKQIRLLDAEIAKRLVAFKAYEKAMQKLAADGTDRGANLAAGRYECFVLGDWDAGLAKLAASSDADLQALAAKELAAPSAPEQQVGVADGWWDLAEGEAGPTAASLHRHAADWYEKAAEKATGLLKAKAEHRLEESRAAAATAESESGNR
jgi:serine/threonine protein kinase